MDRVFLDANVLFSAAYRPGAKVAGLWLLPHVRLLTSHYAIIEALRNLDTPDQKTRLMNRLNRVEIVRSAGRRPLPRGVTLPPKDRPILATAIAVRAHFLLTGDRKHFGPYYGKTVGGVLIIPPARYFPLHI